MKVSTSVLSLSRLLAELKNFLFQKSLVAHLVKKFPLHLWDSLPCSQENCAGPILIKSVHILTTDLFKMYCNVLFLLLRSLPSDFVTSDLPNMDFSSSLCFIQTLSFHLPWLMTLTTFNEVYKLWGSSLCNFLRPIVSYFFIGPGVFPSTLFSNTISICSFSMWETNSHIHKIRQKFIDFIILIVRFPGGKS